MPSFAQIAASEKMPFDEPGVARRAYSEYTDKNATNIVNNDVDGNSDVIPRRKFFKPREEEPLRKYPRLEKGQFLAKSRLPEGYSELIATLYHDCKSWYDKGKKCERMYEDERARCALLQDQVGVLEIDLSRKMAQLRNVLEIISPLVTTSQKAIDAWQDQVGSLEQCTLDIRSLAGWEDEEVATNPALTAAPVVDTPSGSLIDGLTISSFYETAVFAAEDAKLISSRGLDFMLQWQEDGRAVVDQTVHLFKIDTGNQEVKDKYARTISNGFCLLQYDLQLCLKKAFGDNSVKNFGNHTQRTHKFVLPKAILLPKLTDTAIDELTSKNIIMGNKPNQEFCFIPYADVVQVLTKYAQHNCRQAQTTARLDCLKLLLDKFKKRHVSSEGAAEGQGEASGQGEGQALSLDRSEGVSHLSQSSDSTSDST